MLEQVVFCNDGKLRLTGFMKQAIPIEILQKDYAERTGRSADFFLLKYLDSPALIEEGTTISDIMLSIEPWADLLSEYLESDVYAYIQEFKKDSDSECTTETDAWIGIHRTVNFSIRYKEDKDNEVKLDEGNISRDDIRRYISRKIKYTTELEDSFRMEEMLVASQYVKGKEIHYGLSYDPKYKNLPVFIDNRVKIHQFNNKDLTNDMKFINENAHTIKKTDFGDVISIEKELFDGLTLSDVLKAIFNYGFTAYSPKNYEYQNALIIKAVEGDKTENDSEILEESVSEDDWYEKELKRISDIKNSVAPYDDREMLMENIQLAKVPEERLYNKII